ncbi:MAG TPA: hypothetical protein VF727_00455 [Allosphingosinicella sp.]|jgi:hypothetical protein
MSRLRLLAVLAVFALLLTPLRMFGAAEAMAMPHHGTHAAAAADEGHCAPAKGSSDKAPSAGIDCMTACAAIAPAATVATSEPVALAAPASPFIPDARCGLDPEASTPPPRTA